TRALGGLPRERLDLGAGQQLGDAIVAGLRAVPLGDRHRRHQRHDPVGQRGAVQGPYHAIAPGSGVQGAQPVDQSLAALRAHRRPTRDATPETPERSRASSASPAASSSALREPVSPSQAATPRRPWRTRSWRPAAVNSQALNETPFCLAATSTDAATSSSSETERLVTMGAMVAPGVIPM